MPPAKLPIETILPELIAALSAGPAAVLSAPPGTGKSTRVPIALLSAGLAGQGQVVLLQPRRMAARAVARRMAQELSETVGQTVGFQTRFEKKTSARTRILVITEGILIRRFLADPFLEGISCIIFDEFHERSVPGDLALAFSRELSQIRKDLKLLVMSATLQTKKLIGYLGGCPLIQGGTAPHPVQVEYLPAEDPRPLVVRVLSGIRRLLREEGEAGDMLVFLPGAADIRKVQAQLSVRAEVLPLFGALPAREQDRALSPAQQRRVVLSTNIAETSLTVPGVTMVLDSGLHKRMNHDPKTGLDRLELTSISRQSADQRAGRAGRTAPGRVLRLWTAHHHQGLAESELPEIRRVDLASTLLSVLSFQPGDPAGFPFLEAPSADHLAGAVSLLRRLGALGPDGFELKAKGHRLCQLPVHPRLGCLLEKARELDLGAQGALLAALLAERDLCPAGTVGTTDSDIIDRMERFTEWEQNRGDGRSAERLGIQLGTAYAVRDARDQLRRLLGPKHTRSHQTASQAQLQALVLAGFPDRVCRKRAQSTTDAVMVGGRGLHLARESGLSGTELFVALQADAGPRGAHATARVRSASAIDESMLAQQFPKLLRSEQSAVFDTDSGRAIGVDRRFFLDLLLAEQRGVSVGSEQLSAVLAQQAAAQFALVFKPDRRAQQLRARLQTAARTWPKEPWPDVSDDGLRAWLPEICAGKSRLEQIEATDWALEIDQHLDYRLRQRLDTEFPKQLTVPSGSHIRLDYQSGAEPILAVRLQELFGLSATPRIARGRIAVLLHLLAPNGRPAQVTSDLASFWNETYPQVRKELRARYPKHAWPEDPWQAQPIRGTKRRRSR